jgi:hypothetical protein
VANPRDNSRTESWCVLGLMCSGARRNPEFPRRPPSRLFNAIPAFSFVFNPASEQIHEGHGFVSCNARRGNWTRTHSAVERSLK